MPAVGHCCGQWAAFRRGQPGAAAAGPTVRGSRGACPLGQGAVPAFGAPIAVVLCGQADKRLVPAVVLAAVAAAGDRRGLGGGRAPSPPCRGQRGRARVPRPARGGRCAGLYNTYIIRALLSAGGWEGRPAVED